jgi:large subunit ribosomal protein L25
MDKIVLNATRRTVTGKKVGALRREGKIPAIMYGHGFDPTTITLGLQETTLALRGVSGSSLVNVSLDGKEHAALIREKQRDVIRGTLLHIDFQVVSLKEKLRTVVGIELTGEAPALEDFNGILVNGISGVEVECLPQDLPERIVLDVSGLNNIGDGLFVKDVKLPDEVDILTDLEEMIAIITTGTSQEVEEEEIEEGLGEESEPEVIEHGKKEEEEEE